MEPTYPVNVRDLNKDSEYYDEVMEMNSRAEEYLMEFKWCDKVFKDDTMLYYNLGNKLCVFTLHIINNQSSDEADNKLWVITGDLPNMNLDTYNVTSLKDALENYADLAAAWADGVLAGESLEDCYMFDEEPTAELATMLKSRVEFMRDNIIVDLEDILLV